MSFLEWLRRAFTLPKSSNSVWDLLRGHEELLYFVEWRVARYLRSKADELANRGREELHAVIDKVVHDAFEQMRRHARYAKVPEALERAREQVHRAEERDM